MILRYHTYLVIGTGVEYGRYSKWRAEFKQGQRTRRTPHGLLTRHLDQGTGRKNLPFRRHPFINPTL